MWRYRAALRLRRLRRLVERLGSGRQLDTAGAYSYDEGEY